MNVQEDIQNRSMTVYYLSTTQFGENYTLPKYDKWAKTFDVYLQENNNIPSNQFSWETGIKLLLCCETKADIFIQGPRNNIFSFLLTEYSNSPKIKFYFKNDDKCNIILSGVPLKNSTNILKSKYSVPEKKNNQKSQSEIQSNNFILLNQFTMDFCGRPLCESNQILPRYSFSYLIEEAISKLFTYSNDSFINLPKNKATQLAFSFSFIEIIHQKLKHLKIMDSFPYFMKNGGLLFFKDQKRENNVFDFSMAQYLKVRHLKKEAKIKNLSNNEEISFMIESQNDSNTPEILTNPLRIMVYIFPQFASILRAAIHQKEMLMHHYIHMQIDASFQATRPYVYAVPRIEMYWATVPLGFIMAPTESSEMYLYFKSCLETAIEIYNEKCTIDQKINLNISNDVYFLSDTGSANTAFYKAINTTHYGYCTRHTLNVNGAYSQLCSISVDILSTHSQEEWNQNRKSYFESLKELHKQHMGNSDEKYSKKINKFANDLGLANDLSEDTEPLPFDTYNSEELHKLPIDRDYSSDTTNGPEGAHAQYNKISLNYSLAHRTMLVINKAYNEIDTKKFNGPFEDRLSNFQNATGSEHDCTCSLANYMKGVFNVPLCFHTGNYYNMENEKKKIIPDIVFDKDFQWGEEQYIYYLEIDNQTEPWPISRTMWRLCVSRQKIQLHSFHSHPEEKYFYTCLKKLLYFNIKYVENQEQSYEDHINSILYNVSHVLSDYFTPANCDNDILMIPKYSDFSQKYCSYYLRMKCSLLTLHERLKEIPTPLTCKVNNFFNNSLEINTKLKKKVQKRSRAKIKTTPNIIYIIPANPNQSQ